MVFCDINLRMSLYPLLCNSTKYPQFIFMVFIICSYNVPVYLMIHICTFMYVYLNLWPKKNGHLFNNILGHLRICYRASFALEVLKDSKESIGLWMVSKHWMDSKQRVSCLELCFIFSPIFLCWHKISDMTTLFTLLKFSNSGEQHSQ